MNQWKWLLLSLGLVTAASLGLVACGDDEKTSCTTNEDCDVEGGEICIAETGKCEIACTTAGEECDDEAGDLCSDVCSNAPQGFCFPPCSDSAECGDGNFCDMEFCKARSAGLCRPIPSTTCTTNADCTTEGTVCDPVSLNCISSCATAGCADSNAACNETTGLCVVVGAECTADTDCGDGRVCTNNKCEIASSNACTDQQSCIDKQTGSEVLYCSASLECVNTACNEPINTCSQCTAVNGGGRDSDGPQIFAAFQNKISGSPSGRNCKNDLSRCDASAPILCEFGFFAFAAPGSTLPTSDLNNHVGVVNRAGKFNPVFGVKRETVSGNDSFTFQACFAEGGSSASTAAKLTSQSAAFVRNANGSVASVPTTGRSNTLCIAGTK